MGHRNAVDLRSEFIRWQCRVRQYSVRLYDGQPMSAMCPRVDSLRGGMIIGSIITLMVLQDPRESTAYFRFQLQKTNEPEEARGAALRYLAAEYFQIPEMFSDRLTAVFGPKSSIAEQCLRSRQVLLNFVQQPQRFDVPCVARRLTRIDPVRDAAIWQARAFNAHVPIDAEVLSFAPNWKNAVAQQIP
jgi:hypothetical protein